MEEKLLRQILAGMEEIKQGQAELTRRMDNSERAQDEMRQDIRRINQSVAVLETDLTFKVNVVYENIVDINERNRKIDRLEKTQEDHHDRIWALEQLAKASNQ
jgi:uncharacterized protein YlaN (UPF0358 family)